MRKKEHFFGSHKLFPTAYWIQTVLKGKGHKNLEDNLRINLIKANNYVQLLALSEEMRNSNTVNNHMAQSIYSQKWKNSKQATNQPTKVLDMESEFDTERVGLNK